MRTLFPEIEPFKTHMLKVEEPHTLYIEECGNPDGIPVLFVHGGPGGGCSANHRRFFDAKKYHIILFDQRGCGKSTPYASLEKNNTDALVADIEAVRKYLNIEKWVVFGGSWGSTLGLVYAQAFPERVLGLVLRGVFLCTPREIDWFPLHGAQLVYPDYYEDYLKPIPPEKRGKDLLKTYYELLCGEDKSVRENAAKTWSTWEGRAENLIVDPNVVEEFGNLEMAVAIARLECHFFINNCFLEPDQIENNMDKIAHIPGIIVQGRYDMICPMEFAYKIHKKWPASKLNVMPTSGHNAFEVETIDGLVNATDKMAEILQ